MRSASAYFRSPRPHRVEGPVRSRRDSAPVPQRVWLAPQRARQRNGLSTRAHLVRSAATKTTLRPVLVVLLRIVSPFSIREPCCTVPPLVCRLHVIGLSIAVRSTRMLPNPPVANQFDAVQSKIPQSNLFAMMHNYICSSFCIVCHINAKRTPILMVSN